MMAMGGDGSCHTLSIGLKYPLSANDFNAIQILQKNSCGPFFHPLHFGAHYLKKAQKLGV
jgi:hypothetical protein